ncbi:MAG: sensor histidine kinase [Spirochaetales bacterium]|nr:sensor histidine kinase [Spirochaetales bacterium]
MIKKTSNKVANTKEKSTSIKQTLQGSYIIIIALLITAPVISISFSWLQIVRYNKIITNVNKTNRLNQIVKKDVSNEIWDIVAGNKTFSEGRQYEIIDDIRARLDDILYNTEVTENQQMLEVAGRAVNTLTQYVDRLGLQIQNNFLVVENEQILDEIRGVSALISDILQDFIVLEIESAAKTNENIKKVAVSLSLLEIIIVIIAMLFSFSTQRTVTLSINKPINELVNLSSQIAEGNLEARAELPNVEELNNLTENLNIMAVKIKELIDTNIQEQKNLQKSEMKALQAQITPHFLYNTLDTIVWLAEGNQNSEVISVTRSLSSLFRTTLSRGQDWILVKNEFEHIENYLLIQKVRYRDILDYKIDCEPGIIDKTMLKLLLQPLVENALYHGIKNKRGKGKLSVSGWQENGFLCFEVKDNGIGIKPERLKDIKKQINGNLDSSEKNDVYGLYNVNKRLTLYYNSEVKLNIKSTYMEGTSVFFKVPEIINV